MENVHSITTDVNDVTTIYPVAPAAGANYAMPFLPLGRYQLLSVSCVLQASVAVADRYIRINVLNGVFPITHAPFYPAITASLTTAISWAADMHFAPAALPAVLICDTGLGPEIMIDGLLVLQINVQNIQAADQLANIRIVYKTWPQTFYIF